MRCLAYRAYDAFKQTWLASKLFFRGQRYQHFETITVDGQVDACWHNAGDGDRCFDLQSGGNRWHCEVTPCASDSLKKLVATLHLGQRVRVTGTRTYDPPHHIGPAKFTGGKNEIHPITAIESLA